MAEQTKESRGGDAGPCAVWDSPLICSSGKSTLLNGIALALMGPSGSTDSARFPGCRSPCQVVKCAEWLGMSGRRMKEFMAEESDIERNATFSIQHCHCVLRYHRGGDPLLPRPIGADLSALDGPPGGVVCWCLLGCSAAQIA